MGDEEWMSRLRTFAALGVWPSEAGNRPAPRQKKCDTTTRTLILFCITRSNIWTDRNTWANTFQAHFDVGIAVTTSSASALPLPTTLPATATTARPSGPPSMTPAAPEQQLAVDERSVPGMDRVDSLAEYLVGLRTETGQTLNNQQASTIIALWQNLLPYNQQRVAYAARHQLIQLSDQDSDELQQHSAEGCEAEVNRLVQLLARCLSRTLTVQEIVGHLFMLQHRQADLGMKALRAEIKVLSRSNKRLNSPSWPQESL
ncbi:hypothetical protein SKAU_G00412680 [Synaphobranchus kaupii]|uniref:Uncharacterized protein n=1 Tax=Synaphobranchus kaupii TaxID=118154 RepID=A0A9Q1E823_SYNKA|nr:hypothetical protein SKAU_G00412680 [Synaphobranchus kaupii]